MKSGESISTVVISCEDVVIGANAANEVEECHSVYNVVSGVVRSAKLEYLWAKLSIGSWVCGITRDLVLSGTSDGFEMGKEVDPVLSLYEEFIGL